MRLFGRDLVYTSFSGFKRVRALEVAHVIPWRALPGEPNEVWVKVRQTSRASGLGCVDPVPDEPYWVPLADLSGHKPEYFGEYALQVKVTKREDWSDLILPPPVRAQELTW